ncbi:adenine/guanine phosphoribosyltransferase-like PRPP-binding protein [Kitasatospora sp. MAP12-15]|nr:adenine/guanine phosphoribosyltransferase-like PRPP-binding protein [Kitasatospora sp. MAP12-44]
MIEAVEGSSVEETVWSGRWVADRLGIGLTGSPELPQLLGMAVRENPKRAHLLVSQVLGKHVPQRPGAVYGAGLRLGAAVRAVLGDGGADAGPVVVLGYAETATGLGHCVADALGAHYLHSTRRPVAGVVPAGGFAEEHSHATEHLLLPEDPELLDGDGPLVLVDDELSTGRTVLNTIAALHRRWPRERYVIAALVDLREEEDRVRLAEFAASLGARVEAVALAQGRVRLPPGTLERAQALVASTRSAELGECGEVGELVRAELPWPVGLPDGGRHGFTPGHAAELESVLPELAARLAGALGGAERRVLVLGFEELMYVPLRLAGALADALPAVDVRYSTTTRSPVLAVDDPGYAIRTRLVFPAHDSPADGPGERYAYNVAPGVERGRRFDAIVLVLDTPADTPELAGLTALLREVTDRVVLAVVPSYLPAESRSAEHDQRRNLVSGLNV